MFLMKIFRKKKHLLTCVREHTSAIRNRSVSRRALVLTIVPRSHTLTWTTLARKGRLRDWSGTQFYLKIRESQEGEICRESAYP